MPSLKAARAANAAISFSYQPVAVFVGATSGIGEGLARVFARHTKGNARIIIVGRNRAAAEATIAGFPNPTAGPTPGHEFVECDLTLMRNVRRTTAELLERLPRVNFLVMTPGFLSMKGRDETDEGIDKKLAVHYYARWRMIYDLMPLLQKAKDEGQDAKIMTVLHAAGGNPLDLDDLGLKKRYTVGAASSQTTSYNDLMVESFASRHPDMAFTHAYPGFVRTAGVANVSKMNWATRLASPLLSGLSAALAIAPDECAEHLLYGLYRGEKGAFLVDNKGDPVAHKQGVNTPEAREQLWEHTLKETSV